MKKILMAIASAALACGIGFAAVGCGAQLGDINVYNRESGSGTRDAFLELVGIKDETTLVSAGSALTSTGAVLTAVMDDLNGIGYISLGSVDDTVTALKIEGVEATVANVVSGDYKIWRPFEMMYQEDASNDLLTDFVKYLQSADAQEVIEEYGYVSTVSNAPAYEAPETDFTTTSLAIGGSTSVQPLMSKDEDGKTCLISAYKEACGQDVNITYDGTGSGTGITNAAKGTYKIGFASKEVTNADIEGEGPTGEVVIHQLCADGIAIIVNKDNTSVSDLTIAQLKDIYTGKITAWTEFTDSAE